MFKAHDVAKKQHRERAQPQSRKKWGLLEKKKDYRLRAQDFHRKQAHLALLRSKAAQANEDEFNYGMIKSKTRDGALVADRETSQSLSQDAVKLLKTQDEGYIRTLQQAEKRKVEQAKKSLLLPGQGKRTVFVEDETALQKWKPSKDKEPVGPHRRDLDKEVLDGLKELSSRIDREHDLEKLRQEVDLQRELMKRGDKKKLVDKNGNVSYKWKKVRKR